MVAVGKGCSFLTTDIWLLTMIVTLCHSSRQVCGYGHWTEEEAESLTSDSPEATKMQEKPQEFEPGDPHLEPEVHQRWSQGPQ